MRRYESYKDSGVEWLGEIPSHWESFPLFVQAKISSITNHIDKELLSVYLDRGVVKFSDVDEKRTNVTSLDLSKYQLVRKGNLVLNNQQAWRGSVGISNYEGIVSPAYLILELSNKFDPHYANYLFRNGSMVSHYLIASKGVGTIQRNLYWGNLRRTPIFIPPLSEQQKIAQFLDDKTAKIDQAVDLAEKQIALLKEHKQILIQNAVTRGLNPDVPLKDSGMKWIGQVPEHWEVKKIKTFAKINNGLDYKAVIAEEGYPVYGSGGQFAYANTYLYDGEAVLLGRKGTIDKPLYINDKFWTVDTMFYSVCSNKVSTKFFYYCCSSIIPFQYYSTSTALPSMTQSDILNHKVTFPSLKEQYQITAYLDAQVTKIDQAIALKTAQIEKLKEYKSVLINDVVTGKVRVLV